MFDPGALLARTYRLPRGPRVRLRLPQSSDAGEIQALGAARLTELELARLRRFDPRQRLVICATALIDGSARIVGVGAIDLDRPQDGPAVLTSDRESLEGLDELLREALIGRARALVRTRAA
ncbi:MAG TPA: hypothetical protein VLP43_03310 [Solirubrobacteraceae bacterium]|nr:hypothetical protein [Solirubrobacteraceae bacterium]